MRTADRRSKRTPWACRLSLVATATVLGCGDPETTSSFGIENADGGAEAGPTVIRAAWSYRSSQVDVDLTLLTTEAADGCSTTARLVINTATAPEEAHTLDPTPCEILRLTETGDIVLYESPTGHDWSREQLRVNADHEVIELGPWTPEIDAGGAYLFTLSAPDCGGDCDCPELRRRFGSEDSMLSLGRRCE